MKLALLPRRCRRRCRRRRRCAGTKRQMPNGRAGCSRGSCRSLQAEQPTAAAAAATISWPWGGRV